MRRKKAKSLRQYRGGSEALYKVPRSTQQLLDIRRFSSGGIFEIGKGDYSKTYLFTDINYTAEDEDRKDSKLLLWCEILNSMGYAFQLNMINRHRDIKQFQEDMFLPLQRDAFDKYRKAYNEWILEIIDQDAGSRIEKQLYFTISLQANHFESAKAQFSALEGNLLSEFQRLESRLIPLSGEERVKLLHRLCRPGKPDLEVESVDELEAKGIDLVNDIAPMRFKEYEEEFELDHTWCRSLFIESVPSGLPDDFLTKIAAEPHPMIVTVSARTVPNHVGRPGLIHAKMAVDKAIMRQQKVRNQQNLFTSDLSYELQKEDQDITKMLRDIDENDQKLFFGNILIILYADSKEELEKQTESILMIGEGASVFIDACIPLQQEAFRSALPIGINLMPTSRLFTTQSIAAFHPFNAQSIADPCGVIYGVHRIDHSVIRVDRKRLNNGNGWYLGTSGSGKSMAVKMEIGQVILSQDLRDKEKDTFVIIDPQNEYGELVDRYGGSYIPISLSGETNINLMEIPWDTIHLEGEDAFIARKSQLVLTLAQTVMGEVFGPLHQGILDRAIKKLYVETFAKKEYGGQVTLTDLMALLERERDEGGMISHEVKELVDSFVPYISGTMSMFSKPTNAALSGRVICFGCSEIGKVFWPFAMTVIMDHINDTVVRNKQQGINTRVVVEEAHEMMRIQATAEFLIRAFKELRKWGALVTGITQNLPEIMNQPLASTMIRSSEFICLMKCSRLDRNDVLEIMDISEAQLRYVIDVKPGCGIMKAGNRIAPFDSSVSQESVLYQMYNTDGFVFD